MFKDELEFLKDHISYFFISVPFVYAIGYFILSRILKRFLRPHLDEPHEQRFYFIFVPFFIMAFLIFLTFTSIYGIHYLFIVVIGAIFFALGRSLVLNERKCVHCGYWETSEKKEGDFYCSRCRRIKEPAKGINNQEGPIEIEPLVQPNVLEKSIQMKKFEDFGYTKAEALKKMGRRKLLAMGYFVLFFIAMTAWMMVILKDRGFNASLGYGLLFALVSTPLLGMLGLGLIRYIAKLFGDKFQNLDDEIRKYQLETFNNFKALSGPQFVSEVIRFFDDSNHPVIQVSEATEDHVDYRHGRYTLLRIYAGFSEIGNRDIMALIGEMERAGVEYGVIVFRGALLSSAAKIMKKSNITYCRPENLTDSKLYNVPIFDEISQNKL